MSSQPTTSKLALITGASKGIGRATALQLSSQGYLVVINYSSDSAPADALVSQIGADKSVAIKGNAGDVSDIERLIEEAVKWGKEHGTDGKIHVLIPNAADPAVGKSLEQTSEDDFEKAIGLNVKGPFFLVQVCLVFVSPFLTQSRYPASASACRTGG
jgi:3-oxoacyl-[acyl-carrier protein] reductase